MNTLLQKRTEILSRPSFRFFETTGSKIVAALNQAINNAYQEYYETYRLTRPLLEASNIATGFTLPAGVAWGANGKIYNVPGASLPADLGRIKKLWILNDTNVATASSSTYDDDTSEGTGIPNDTSTSLTVTSVFHEMLGAGAGTGNLLLFVGSTAAGTTPKLELTYAATWTALAADGDLIQVPDYEIVTTFDPLVNAQLRALVGYDF